MPFRAPLLASLGLAAAAACNEVSGGAVEASWTIRTADGRGSSCACADPPIETFRFEIVARGEGGVRGADACAGKESCRFACTSSGSTGATKFEIPPGDYEIAVVPLDAAGGDLRMPSADRRSVDVPANPQRRRVVYGQVTQLDSFLVEASCAAACGGDDTTRICRR